ncbi:MAG: ribbon-helix-helix protein, CopG family [Patescibacteria group bacterium]
MSRYTVSPKPYKVEIEGSIKWVPKVHIYIHEGNRTIDRTVTWKRDILFSSEEEARRFIDDAMENIERINIQLYGKHVAVLKAIAEEHGQSLAEVIRQAIAKYLPAEEKK